MKLRNQNGAALIVVLLIITVFFVLGLSIFSSALSNTKQVNKTKKEMQALDLAEMGILYYQNHFKEKTYKLLKTPIEIAVDDQENDTLDKKVTAVYNMLNKQNVTKELEEYSQHPINDYSKYTLKIKNISYDQHKISVEIASTGIKNSDIQETIDATIELSIQQLIEDISKGRKNLVETEIPDSLTNCDYTKGLENGCFYDNIIETANFGTINGDIKSGTIVYINGNAKFDAINGGIRDHSKIRIYGDAEFGPIHGQINGADIFIKKNAAFVSISSNKIENSKICVGGEISGDGIKKEDGKYPNGIYSYKENPTEYINAGCPLINDQNDQGNENPANFDPSLINLHTRLNVRYH